MSEVLDCRKCSHFTIHPDYPYLVICVEMGRIVARHVEVCKDYVEKSWDELAERLSEVGFLYCAECRKPVFAQEELTNHRAELIPLEFFADEVACEESCCAD